MEENKQNSGLEELEQLFLKEKEAEKTSEKNKIKKIGISPQKARLLVSVIGGMLLIILIGVVLMRMGAKKDPTQEAKIKDIPGFLTEDQETDWEKKKVDKTEVFIIINTNLEVRDNKVDLNLANPPYSAYPLQIKITDESGETIYYESEVLNPGKYLEKVELQNLPEESGEYTAVVQYTFFAEKNSQNVVGEHTVTGQIIIP